MNHDRLLLVPQFTKDALNDSLCTGKRRYRLTIDARLGSIRGRPEWGGRTITKRDDGG